MYTPRHFAETDLALLDALHARDPFVTLVTVADGAPEISHLPVLYRRDGDRVRIEGHWARPNPQATHAGPASVILHGPNAYVSPGWYPDKEPAARVPTWNYVVAHLHGMLDVIHDEVRLGAHVDRLSAHFESRVGGDWRFEFEREAQRRQLRGLVGFTLDVERIELKAKLSQNHPTANRIAVREALAALGGGSGEIAALMAAREG